MALWDKLRGELIDIVEWIDDTRDTMVWRFPRHNNEIKNGAKLIVRESQVAAFVNEGSLTDLFMFPGTYTLSTQNLPILSTLKGWKHGFESPFKAEVYFVSTRVFTERKWGTKNPIMLRDPEFGPTRLRAFGSFAIKVSDPATFLKQVVGTDHRFSVEEIGNQVRDMVTARFADVLGESKIPVLDLASNYDELGKFLTQRIAPDFEPFGLQIVALMVENISLPPEVEAALDKRTSMGVIGDLNRFTQFQTATAIGDAAKNPGGLAGAGAGMGAGFAMANQMGAAMAAPTGQQTATPPPLPQPASSAYFIAEGGKQAGPFNPSELGGRITRDTLVWRQGMAQWTRAADVADLKSIVESTPPPLP
ncbi:MAG: SPFH domain-containing protein [Planctomycetota bacterium]|nr:SPFH domain-containing protein [Planctomycetota bacterium]